MRVTASSSKPAFPAGLLLTDVVTIRRLVARSKETKPTVPCYVNYAVSPTTVSFQLTRFNADSPGSASVDFQIELTDELHIKRFGQEAE